MNSSVASSPPARILIADDNRDSRSILAACLEEAGYEVDTALDADEAMVNGLAHRPDLFLLDVLMPRKDGFQLCRELRANPVLKQTPIILITGLDSKVDRFKGIDAGCDDFLSKPVERTELLSRVQTLLRLHMYREQLDERKTFEAVLQHVSDGILVLDASWRIGSLNQAAARLLNLDVTKARGVDLLEWVYRSFQVSIARPAFVDPAETTLRFEISRPEQGNNAALFLSANRDMLPLVDGQVSGSVLTLRDVTQSKKQTKMHQTFLSLVSHKLRTPIACITEHVSLFQDGLLGEISGEQRHSIDRIKDQTDRLKELVEKMLGFIQLDDSDWDHAGDAFVLNDALQSVVARVIARHPQKKAQVAYQMPEGLYGLGISSQHFQILIDNLVDNAVKFCDKPSVEITLGYQKTADGQHELYVADNGPGVPNEEYERIFQEFYQIDRFFTGNVAGVGLGLALSRRLVEKAGGKIWVTSELGLGATFHFTLPVVGSVIQHAA